MGLGHMKTCGLLILLRAVMPSVYAPLFQKISFLFGCLCSLRIFYRRLQVNLCVRFWILSHSACGCILVQTSTHQHKQVDHSVCHGFISLAYIYLWSFISSMQLMAHVFGFYWHTSLHCAGILWLPRWEEEQVRSGLPQACGLYPPAQIQDDYLDFSADPELLENDRHNGQQVFVMHQHGPEICELNVCDPRRRLWPKGLRGWGACNRGLSPTLP